MEIGNLKIDPPVALAPMAGVTNEAFRVLAKEQGAGIVYTEMVSAQALARNTERSKSYIKLSEEEHPIGIQLMGGDPEMLLRSAEMAVAAGADLIDINYGCPAPKVNKGMGGAALLRWPDLAIDLARQLVEHVDVPVTAKFRLGWDDQTIIAPDLAQGLEAVGIKAVTVHGRTREQKYEGKSDWQTIAEVKKGVRIPVIGNGDVRGPEDALRMIRETSVDGVMVGRGALGNPWIFSRIKRALNGEDPGGDPLPLERVQTARRHLEHLIRLKGERTAAAEMHKHAAWYLIGFEGASEVRTKVNHFRVVGEYRDLFDRLEVEFLQGV